VNFIEKFIARKFIPKGQYCYSGHLGADRCIFYTHIKDEGIKIPYCLYLEDGDISNLNKDDFEKLKNKYLTLVYAMYSADELWDQAKCCGLNCDH